MIIENVDREKWERDKPNGMELNWID